MISRSFFLAALQPTKTIAGALAFALTLSAPVVRAQSSPPQSTAQPQPTQPAVPEQPPGPMTPGGKILFSRDASTADDSQAPNPQIPAAQKPATGNGSLAVTDAERSALAFTAYDLDLHLTPASAGISARAAITVRNDSAVPLRRLIFDISSSLRWDGFSIHLPASVVTPLAFATHPVDTDADHTGRVSEAAVTLAQPLAPGESLSLTALYSGAIPPSAERLIRIGAPANQALAEDWDAIAPNDPDDPGNGTALRGFGNVLWYPVSAPPVFLGDGAQLFQAVGRTKLRQSTAAIRLRLAIEYVGDPPDAAFFCGRREQLTAISDNPNVPIAESPGIATATFDSRPLGFRTPSLFITGHAASDAGTPAHSNLIAAVTSHDDALPAYSAAATLVEPLLTDWFGAEPLDSLTILDHPGQPFEDDALLVRPIRAADAATLTPSLAHSLTHAWVHSSHPWIDEGLAQFMSLLWTERSAGRSAALAELQDQAHDLALAEPEVPADTAASSPADNAGIPSQSGSAAAVEGPATALSPARSGQDLSAAVSPTVSPAGKSLADATGEVFYRIKAAAVWWMLRGIVGDDELQQTLRAYRRDPKLDRDPTGLEQTLEKLSHKDLHWFFDNWVYRDRGLPDLSIVSVTPSQLETSANPRAGWLVAVVVHNDGYAEAEVPVTVRSRTANETQRLRIPGRSSASIRIVFAGTPEQVQVNDGGVPETQTSIHTREITLPDR